ncbi:MAG: VWA domain-containing protein [Myxococcota bacterium]
MSRAALMRWRLLLGEAGADALGGSPDADQLDRERALGWLYEREVSEGQGGDNDGQDRRGSLGASALSVPEWINKVHELFPKETVERLERDAVETYKIHEVVTNPEVLERIEPSETLLRAVLHTKHLMNPEVLAMARALVQKVVRQLIEKLAKQVKHALYGSRARRRSLRASARNFDAKGTIKKNLDGWDPEKKRLLIRRPLFLSRARHDLGRWQIILLVDESGSMLGSVIHAAVVAACLWGLPGTKTHLAIFDTEVVDLTESVTDPVEILMQVQLGGGTDIQKAVSYAAQLVEAPARTIVVVISDFFEGGSAEGLVRSVAELVSQGTIVLGLAALDEQANPAYDRQMAARLVDVGAHVGAMTPAALVEFIVEKVKG